ncbi:MAG TPA: imidazolonepropionase [Thermoanaerobaculaceae bacterium]|nr:imidazolonepropionase [Thermoanaerobaculaceae bacterium]HRS15920.1 imidazolonepropionase [Thermoanaerobaculaceae bacterium]
MSLLVVNAAQVVTPVGREAHAGARQGEVRRHPHAVVRLEGWTIVFVGEKAEHDRRFGPAEEVLDAGGGCVVPAFVDPHTHLPFAGYREGEFDRRLRGETYAQIAASGGGIVATVAATRAASEDELTAATAGRLDRQLLWGTCTTEAKSGYGLNLHDELKQLSALARAAADHPVEVVPTAMPAHEVPPEWRHDPDGYVRLVVETIHPAIAAARLAEGVDVFCENGVFSPHQTRRLLADAPRYGWRIHLHADELSSLGGAELAAELGAASASHLLHVSASGIAALAAAGIVAVVLPGVSFFLRDRYAPVRALVEAGVPIALATDCNPGSSHTESMPAIMALACLGAGMYAEEALVAATLNAAAALGRADRLGSIEPGKQADLLVLEAADPRHVVYHFGVNLVRHVVKAGRVVVRDGRRVA